MLSDLPGGSHMPGREAEPTPRTLVAPLWHTALLVAAILTVSMLGLRSKSQSAMVAHHVRVYLETIAWEWVLAAAVLWGVWLRGTPWLTLIGEARPEARAWLGWMRDAGIALGFWVASTIVLGALAVLLKLAHLGLSNQSVAALAPGNGGELFLFFILSLSAGFCEELLFRGYLQQQFERIGGGRVWIGVAASALLFGLAHLYEGAAGVIAITLFGVMFSLLTVERRSLRPGMMAHAWHDACSGLALFLLRHTHLL